MVKAGTPIVYSCRLAGFSRHGDIMHAVESNRARLPSAAREDPARDIFDREYSRVIAQVTAHIDTYELWLTDALCHQTSIAANHILEMASACGKHDSIGEMLMEVHGGRYGSAEQDALQIAIRHVGRHQAERLAQAYYEDWTCEGSHASY